MNPDVNFSRNTVPHLAAGVPADAGQLILHRRAALVRSVIQQPGGHLLDFGCGNGAQTLLLASEFSRTTGVDINEDFLKGFVEAAEAMPKSTDIRVLATGGRPVDLPDASVDVATSFTVLEHVADEMVILKDLHRLLKPGGKLILSVPNRWWIFETHGADLPLLPWNRVPFFSWWPKALHDRWARARIYTRSDIIALAEAADFQVDEVFQMTAPMDMIPWPAVRNLARQLVFRGDRTASPFLATEIFLVASKAGS